MSEISEATRTLEARGWTREAIVRAAKALRERYAALTLEGALKMLLEDTMPKQYLTEQPIIELPEGVVDVLVEEVHAERRRAATYQRRARALVKQCRRLRDIARESENAYILVDTYQARSNARPPRSPASRPPAPRSPLRGSRDVQGARNKRNHMATLPENVSAWEHDADSIKQAIFYLTRYSWELGGLDFVRLQALSSELWVRREQTYDAGYNAALTEIRGRIEREPELLAGAVGRSIQTWLLSVIDLHVRRNSSDNVIADLWLTDEQKRELGIVPPVDDATHQRISDLFYKKLAEREPDHPWLRSVAQPVPCIECGATPARPCADGKARCERHAS